MLRATSFLCSQQPVLAVATLSEEHLGHPQLLVTTRTIDFHLPGSASLTCLIAPQLVLKWARPTHFQWQVFAGPSWFAQIESDCLKDWASRIEGSSFQKIFMVKGVEGSLDLAKLQPQLTVWRKDKCCSRTEVRTGCSSSSWMKSIALSYRLLPCLLNWRLEFAQTPHCICDCSQTRAY